MAALGDLFVNIGARTDGLNKGLGQAESRIGKFSAGAARAAKAMAAMGAAATAAGVAIGTRMVAQQLKAIDATSKLSRQLNTTTESLAVMNRAADLAGIDNMDRNLDQLNRRLSQAATGTGEAGRAMDRLGLSAAELQRLPVDERIRQISRAMQSNVDVTEQAALANDLFGRSGGQMLEVLRDADGLLDTAAAQADAFGLAIGEIDAVTIEQANDAMSAIRAVIEGIAKRITIQVAPAIRLIAERFQDAAMESRGWEDVVTRAMNIAGRVVGLTADAIYGIRLALRAVQVAALELAAPFAKVYAGIQRATNTVMQFILDRVQAVIAQLNRIPGVDISMDGIDNLAAQFDAAEKQVQNFANSAQKAALDARIAMHELAAEELPSEKIRQFMTEAQEAAREAAEAVIEARRQMAAPDAEIDAAMAEELAAQRDHLAQRVDQLQQALQTETESERNQHAERLQLLEDALENELVTREQYNELLEREQDRHGDAMMRISERMNKGMADSAAREAKRERDARVKNLHDTQNASASILGTMAQDNKKFGIAQAIVNTWRGVSESLAAYPWPVSAAMAASSLAAGMQTVRSIKSGSTSGSIGTSGGMGAATSGFSEAPQARQSDQGAARNITIRAEGEVFSRDVIRSLAESLTDAVGDNVRIGFSG